MRLWDDRRRKLSPRRRYRRANDRCYATLNASGERYVVYRTVPSQIASAAARLRTADEDSAKPLVLQAPNAFSICVAMVNAQASRAVLIECERSTFSQITRQRDPPTRISNHPTVEARGPTFRPRLQAFAYEHSLRGLDSEPGIRRPEICRLRLASASGISALPEMWPSG